MMRAAKPKKRKPAIFGLLPRALLLHPPMRQWRPFDFAVACGLLISARNALAEDDHAPGGHDDVANCVAGVLTHLVMKKGSYDLNGFFDDAPDDAGAADDRTISADYQATRLQNYVNSGGRWR